MGQFKTLGLERVVLLHVVDIYHAQGLAPMFEKNAKEMIKEYKQYLDDLNIDAQTLVIQGEVKSTIVNVVHEYDIDCIIMGSTIKSPIKGRMLGRTTDYIAHNSGKMLLVEKYELSESGDKEIYGKVCTPTFKRPLISLDLSKKSMDIITKLTPIQDYLDKVYLINVVERTKDSPELKQLVEENKSKLAEIGEKLEGVTVETIVSSGNPAEEINNTAEDKDVTLIILGATGKGLKKLVLGSTSYELLNKTRKPVLLIS